MIFTWYLHDRFNGICNLHIQNQKFDIIQANLADNLKNRVLQIPYNPIFTSLPNEYNKNKLCSFITDLIYENYSYPLQQNNIETTPFHKGPNK